MQTKEILPEVIAAISAAVQMMGGGKVRAVRIKRSEMWVLSARSTVHR